MQFSSDLPYVPTAIAEYLASGQTLSVNVPKQADRAFRFDLKKADPKRWVALETELHRDFIDGCGKRPAET